MHDLIIVGGGPAALAAAAFALDKNLNFRMVYEQLGGWTGAHQRLRRQTEEEHIAGEGVVNTLELQVLHANRSMLACVTRVTRSEAGFDVETARHGSLEATAVLIATGATPVRLKVPGAREFAGYGLAYSATTHIRLLAGKRVAVIGATERALRGVVELVQAGSQVYLIAEQLDDSDTPLAGVMQQLAGVEVLDGWTVERLSGGFSLQDVLIRRGSETRQLGVDAAFVDLGLVPNSEMVGGLVQTDVNGFIKVDERRATSVPGLFAAGDVTTAVGEQKLIAIGEGARAAWTAYGYVLARRAARPV